MHRVAKAVGERRSIVPACVKNVESTSVKHVEPKTHGRTMRKYCVPDVKLNLKMMM